MIAGLLSFLVRLFTGATAAWSGCQPSSRQRLYFANHTSNLDAVVIWASLPPEIRERTRPVAARDYWTAGPVRRYLAHRVFHAVLIERRKPTVRDNPLEQMVDALGTTDSLILFPEGTRNAGPEPGAFKGGLFHLARRRPDVELVPVYLENMNRILPKGELLAVPILGRVRFGVPVALGPDETREDFLIRCRTAVTALHGESEAS
jgi:1-acyl-sn-glycerol-3-phosphate acyltransferase